MAYVTLPTQTSTDLDSAANINQLQDNISYVAAAAGSPVRHTVLSGPVDGTTKLPNALSTGTGSTVVWTASSTTATVVTFADGFNAIGASNKIGYLESSLTFTGLTASTTCYLYMQRESGGTLTSGFGVIQPYYEYVAPSATSGMHWFDIGAMKMYRYSTTTWVQKDRVFVGEAILSGTAIQTVVTYAYCGLYDTGFFLISANSNYSKNHNLGYEAHKFTPKFYSAKTSAGTAPKQNAYYYYDPSFYVGILLLACDRKAITCVYGGGAGSYVDYYGTGGYTNTAYGRWVLKRNF